MTQASPPSIKEWKIYFLLLICSFLSYWVFLHFEFAHLNSMLSSITSDSIKNYYTFAYHAALDRNPLRFEGMNYPFGEHAVYTDCQPLISGLLRFLPIPSNYLIGTLHFLLYASFIVSPLIIYAILVRLNVDSFSAFFSALAIALLSPQFLKINAGHHALAYGCMIPLCMLLLMRLLDKASLKNWTLLSSYNTLVFFIHPYMGFCLAAFSLMTLLFRAVFLRTLFKEKTFYISIFLTGIFPILFFKVFMWLTDQHSDRPSEPYGLEVMVENLDSLLAPDFGPFKHFLQALFPNPPGHFEGHTYLGLFVMLLTLFLIVAWPFFKRKIKSPSILPSFFLSSLVLLLISFGYHQKVLQLFDIKIEAVNQFRAVCRFAWVFYFVLPICLIPTLLNFLNQILSANRYQYVSKALILLFFTSNFLEAGGLLRHNHEAYWHFRNFFNAELLNSEEKVVLDQIKNKSVQAILPLPLFHGGSEMYDRNGSSNSMAPAMMYSYHTALPILSMMASRTSITETQKLIQIINSYKKEKAIIPLLNGKDFLIIKTRDELLPDEERLVQSLNYFHENDSLSFSFISQAELIRAKKQSTAYKIELHDSLLLKEKWICFIESEKREPFQMANIKDYQNIFTLDSNIIASGKYVLSLHYYFKPITYRDIALDLIVTEALNGPVIWKQLIPLRKMSGFYGDYAVFEIYIDLLEHGRYEFILKGGEDRQYHISDFLIRPAGQDVYFIKNSGDTLYNNYLP